MLEADTARAGFLVGGLSLMDSRSKTRMQLLLNRDYTHHGANECRLIPDIMW